MELQAKIEQGLDIPIENIFFQEPMKKHTTFKIGGPAECFIKIEAIEQLKKTLNFARENDIPITVLGNGSNVLVLDKGIQGLVLKIDIKGISVKKLESVKNQDVEIAREKEQEYLVTVSSGEKMAVIAHFLLQHEISGFENFSRNSRECWGSN